MTPGGQPVGRVEKVRAIFPGKITSWDIDTFRKHDRLHREAFFLTFCVRLSVIQLRPARGMERLLKESLRLPFRWGSSIPT